MPPKIDFRARTLGVARAVGGAEGRMLSTAVAAMSRPGTGSKTFVGSQTDAIKAFLGGFTPGCVPIGTKKRMLRHAQVKYASAAAKAPLMGAELFFESNSTEVASLLKQTFLDTGLLRRTLRSSLTAMDFGFSAHEQVWDVEDVVKVEWDESGTAGAINHKSAEYPLLFVPKQMKDLDPSSVGLLRDPHGDLVGVVYSSPNLVITSEDIAKALTNPSAYNMLAKNKFFVFTVDGDWQNHYGVGRLDAVYDPWYWQTIIYLICNRWFERKSDPPMVGYAPSNAALADPGLNATEYDPASESESPVLLIARALDKLRATGNVALPSDPYYDEQGKPSPMRAYSIEEIKTQDAHPAFLAYLEHLDTKITRGYLVPEAIAASSKGGGNSGYGSLQVLADVYASMENDTLVSFVEDVNESLIQPFLAYNGIKEKASLRTSGVTSKSRESMATAFLEVLKADNLAEQAFGRIYPSSMTMMVDRGALFRANGIPFLRPDPDAPPMKPPQDPATAAAGASTGAANQPPKGPAKK